MANHKLRADFSKVEVWRDLYWELAIVLGFDHCGCFSRDGLADHLRDFDLGFLKVHLQPGETLRLGVFGFGGLRRRNPGLAREFEKIIARANKEAEERGHGPPSSNVSRLPCQLQRSIEAPHECPISSSVSGDFNVCIRARC